MMKFLIPKYWKKINTDPFDNKGICFENLVQDLLIAEYGKATFQKTKCSWDGGKDFFYYSAQKNFWAECKNYASNINLKVLASTLIMAQISEIDTILFYSYSPININTKAKLFVDAEKRGRVIYFYDDIVLERKIFQYWDYVGDRYFQEFIYEDIFIAQSDHCYEAKCLLYGNPLDSGAAINKYELKHLTLFKMFEMDICIINRENTYKTISLSFEKIEQIKAQFEIYPDHIVKSKMIISLAPYEGKTIRLWLIPIKENCVIPYPYINGIKLSLPKNVEFKVFKRKNSRRLIGQSYEQCIADFKREVLFETNKIKIGIFYGNSGTGKSKLYEECLNVSKINGYEIIDFVSIINMKNEQSVQDFIQKLLINMYDISLNEFEQIFKIITFSLTNDQLISKQPEYCMLAEIFNVTNSTDMQNWLNKYLDLIILKLAKNKFLIAVDNIQFLNENILCLINDICNKLNRITPCSTKLFFTFNIDYIKRNSKADELLGNYTTNHALSFSRRITGFESSNECFEFLQEVLSIGDIFKKTEIRKISENMNKNPFYLEQMIYWLRDKHALEVKNNHYVVKNSFLLKSLIKNIPNTVFDILEKRWDYYKEHEEKIDDVIIFFSALHLYKELEKEEIDCLNISWTTIKELDKMGFIMLEDTTNVIIIKFQHDLIDKFFSKMYSSFSKKIIDYENQYNVVIRTNNLRYYFGKLYSKETGSWLSNTQLSEIFNIHIDGRLAYEFYLLVFNKYIESFDCIFTKDKNLCINNIYKILTFIHDILGNMTMKKCVNTLLFKMKNFPEVFHYIEYGRLLIYISEAYDSMGNYREAFQLIKEYKEKAFESQDENTQDIEQKKLLSEIYNRLHVYWRHQVINPLENREIMKYLNTSSEIADHIQYTVMQYVNYSDRGYLYYDLPLSNKMCTKAAFYWEKACKTYEKGGAETKELNYLRKKVQLNLLNGEAEKAVHDAQIGLEQIDFSPHAYQQAFFKWWFYHALAESYLLDYRIENTSNIEKALEHAHFYSELLESNKKFYYLQLQAIYMYYSGKRDAAIISNREALKLVEASNYKMKMNSLKHQLLENETTMLSNASKTESDLYSQIHTVDCLFNLPCL